MLVLSRMKIPRDVPKMLYCGNGSEFNSQWLRVSLGQAFLQLRSRKAKSEVAELERKIGQTMENAVLRRCLQRVEEQQKLQALTMRGSSIPSSSKK